MAMDAYSIWFYRYWIDPMYYYIWIRNFHLIWNGCMFDLILSILIDHHDEWWWSIFLIVFSSSIGQGGAGIANLTSIRACTPVSQTGECINFLDWARRTKAMPKCQATLQSADAWTSQWTGMMWTRWCSSSRRCALTRRSPFPVRSGAAYLVRRALR